jgi:hypothetical protein
MIPHRRILPSRKEEAQCNHDTFDGSRPARIG